MRTQTSIVSSHFIGSYRRRVLYPLIFLFLLLMLLVATPLEAQEADSDALARVNGLHAIAPTVKDPLHQDDGHWSLKRGVSNAIFFTSDGLHLRSRTTDEDEPYPMMSQSDLVADALLVEVEAQHVKGTLFNGFGFYLMHSPGDYTFFYISTNGFAAIERVALNGGEVLVPWQESSAIRTQSRAINQLRLLVEEGHATLFANDREVARVDGLALEGATLGLVATSYKETVVEIAFRDLCYWNLDKHSPAPAPMSEQPAVDCEGEKIDYIEEGKVFLEQAKWQQALEALTQAIELDPTNVEAYYYRGVAHYQLGAKDPAHYGRAIEDLTRATESEDFFDRAIAVLNKINQVADAELLLANYTEQIEDSEHPAALYARRGIVYRDKLGDYEMAIADLTQAIEHATEYQRGDYFVERAFAHSENDNSEAAIEDATQAIEDEYTTDICSAYAHRGVGYAELGDYEEAESDLKRARTNCSDDAATLAFVSHQLGIVRYYQGKLEDALSHFNDAIANRVEAARGAARESWESDFASEAEENFEALMAYFETLIAERQLQAWREGKLEPKYIEYMSVFEAYDEMYAGAARTYGWRGGIYEDQAENDLAIESYTIAIEVDPTDTSQPYWHVSRGGIFYDQGDFEAARDDLTTAIALGRPDTLEAGTAYILLGLIASEEGNHQEAIAHYSMAISIRPGEAIFYFGRALTFYDLDDYESAIADLEMVLELSEDAEVRADAEEWLRILE